MIAAILRIDITKTDRMDYTAEHTYDHTFIYFMDDNRIAPENFIRDVKHFIVNDLFIYPTGIASKVSPFKLAKNYQEVLDWNKASQSNMARYMEAFFKEVEELYNDDSAFTDNISIDVKYTEVRANIGAYGLV